MADEVEASGAVLWRQTGDRVEVALVHRPRHRDWSLPKGKCDPGEAHPATALREVEEETGYRAELGPGLGLVRYRLHDGRGKVVRWWSARETGGSFTVNDEVDALEWLPVVEAAQRCTHDLDREVLRRFAAIGE